MHSNKDAHAVRKCKICSSFKGVPTANGMFATIRTMYAQLTSTRLFNENYFAFRAALDDSLAKGVKLTVSGHKHSDPNKKVFKAERLVIDGKTYDLYPDRN